MMNKSLSIKHTHEKNKERRELRRHTVITILCVSLMSLTRGMIRRVYVNKPRFSASHCSQFLTEEEDVPPAPVMCGKYPSLPWITVCLPPLPFRKCKQYAGPAAVEQRSSCSARWSSAYYWVAASAPRAWAGTAPYGHTGLLVWLTQPALVLSHRMRAKRVSRG